jgi:hypothetical protein
LHIEDGIIVPGTGKICFFFPEVEESNGVGHGVVTGAAVRRYGCREELATSELVKRPVASLALFGAVAAALAAATIEKWWLDCGGDAGAG